VEEVGEVAVCMHARACRALHRPTHVPQRKYALVHVPWPLITHLLRTGLHVAELLVACLWVGREGRTSKMAHSKGSRVFFKRFVARAGGVWRSRTTQALAGGV